VKWLLDKFSSAALQQIPNRGTFPVAPPLPEYGPELKEVIRFTPAASKTSGLFIARITKKPE
jgi:16S rRNA C967 or C1407 C5-methylase (RsmB/RsmF family)